MKKVMKNKIILILSLLFIGITANAQKEDQVIKLANSGEVINSVKNDIIPIEIWNDYILLKVRINDKENYFLWDNGFTFSALDKSLVETYNLKTIPEIESVKGTDAINTKVNLDIKVADLLSFGKNSIKNSPILVNDMTAFLGNSDKVKGILGAATIKKFNWKFNFDENYVVVSEKPFEDMGKTIPFQLSPYNVLLVDLEINGFKSLAEVDFGTNTNTLDISIDAAPLFAKNLKTTYYGISASSVSGLSSESASYSVKGFDYKFFNGLKLDFPFEVSLTPNERGARIGNRLFRNYNTIFNFSTSEIKLINRKKTINHFPTKSYGFVLIIIDNEFKIILKSKNSNTEKFSNVKVNDTVRTVDGKTATYFKDIIEFRNYQINKLNNNEEIRLELMDGKIIKLMPVENIYE